MKGSLLSLVKGGVSAAVKGAASAAVNGVATAAVNGAVLGVGNGLVALTSGVLAASMISYSSFVLYDTAYTQNQARSVSSDLLSYRPTIIDSEDVPLSGSSLALINDDYRAWLTIDNTAIDYPVMQGQDDLYYASHDIYKNASLTGAIYVASANSPDLSDSYNLIYGHHMDQNIMFGALDRYLDADFLNYHQTGILATDDTVYDLTVLAVAETDAYEQAFYRAGNRLDEVKDFLRNPGSSTTVPYCNETLLSNANRVVALSTCASATTNGRLIVFFYMVPRVDSSGVSGFSYSSAHSRTSRGSPGETVPEGTPAETSGEPSPEGGTPDGTPNGMPGGGELDEAPEGGTPEESPGGGTPEESPGGGTPDGTPGGGELDESPGGGTPIGTPGGGTPDGMPGGGTPDGTPGGGTPDGTPGGGTPVGTPGGGTPDGTPGGGTPDGTPGGGTPDRTPGGGTPVGTPGGGTPDGTPGGGTPDGTPGVGGLVGGLDDIPGGFIEETDSDRSGSNPENSENTPRNPFESLLELTHIEDEETPLAQFARRFQPRGDRYGGRAWALVNLIALFMTAYLLLPLLHLRAKYFCVGTMKKVNRRKADLRTASDLDEDQLTERLLIHREAAEEKAREEGRDVETAVQEAEASGFAEITQDDFTKAVEALYYHVEQHVRRFRVGIVLEALIVAAAAYVFVHTENMRLPMVLIDKWTPLMLLFLVLCWVTDVCLARYRDKLMFSVKKEDSAADSDGTAGPDGTTGPDGTSGSDGAAGPDGAAALSGV